MDLDNAAIFRTILFNDESIEVVDLQIASNQTKESSKVGKFVCLYKVTVVEIEVFQIYESIAITNPPVVGYSFNELRYKANSSLHLNSFTQLREITFKDDNSKVTNLERSKFKAIGRLKLKKDFVINTERNPNGTLFCLYDVPVGEFLI
uniref:DUF7583 domain-containing protein n=1 Tax=Strongyloides venezuelensis TaxID=75913 RepID=A0A0K0FM50_STRVS